MMETTIDIAVMMRPNICSVLSSCRMANIRRIYPTEHDMRGNTREPYTARDARQVLAMVLSLRLVPEEAS